ncbi:TetR/AcrR family transcriptional regulator [Umezawaea endophytica]|uniref:TetR/AcrR family transcriptional regulator n=1 Tax=Umezawaea endophytica TaxID=1654476 RepID=A0A9X2VIA9_9PSEU|nr:TetR/AcrR family transcriptional regulator [Umezawaea endophytica]MCS7475538.1 TetR/AcrR family transcriptional regulator [Umezawaea endophytica]
MSDAAGPPRPRARHRRGEGDLLRAEILAAATELLDASGDARAVTLRAVARGVGITASSIYPHFPDQSSVVLAVVRQAFAGLVDWLRSAVDQADDDPRQRLHALCQAYLDFSHDHPRRYRTMFGGIWTSAADSGTTPDVLADLGAEAVDLVVDCLTACVAAGCCTSEDPEADAVALWVGLHGLAHQRAASSAFPWPADITRRITVPLSHLVA